MYRLFTPYIEVHCPRRLHKMSTTRSLLPRSNEAEPLLSGIEEIPRRDPEDQVIVDIGTPLPKAQFTILCILRILDPMAFSQIFPYINQLIEDLGVAKDASDIGYYSGLVVCVLLFTSMRIGP
jgi:hypothetical protein